MKTSDLLNTYYRISKRLKKMQNTKELEKIQDIEIIKKKILKIIMSVKNPMFQYLLIERYINFKSWDFIGEKIGYSGKHTRCNLHAQALKEVDKVLKNESK